MSTFRDISYYGWQQIKSIGPEPNTGLPHRTAGYIYDIKEDRKKRLYMAALETNSISGSTWLILRSIDKGITWSEIDRVYNSGACLSIAFDSNDQVYCAGYERVNSEFSNLLIRKSDTGNLNTFYNIDSTGSARSRLSV